MRIPESEWKWCGYAGHFICSPECLMHLHTRVGDYRISTVGDWHSRGAEERREIGCGRMFETYVFEVSGDADHGMGTPVEWSEIDSEGYNEPDEACAGHLKMCDKYAQLAGEVA